MRCYGLWEVAIAMDSDDPTLLPWLDEFLTPAFELREARGGEFAVAVTRQRSAYEDADRARPGIPGNEVACFARDHDVTHRLGWKLADASTLVEDPRRGLLWRLAPTKLEVLVHRAPERARAEAMRVVRELATSALLARTESVFLHAAAIEVDGRALLITGGKEAGKTTLLCYLAAAAGTAILTNDRVLVRREGDAFGVRGVPTIVSVRGESRRLIPCSFSGVPNHDRPVFLTVAESAAERARLGPADSDDRLRLSPAQLARELGVSLAPRAHLGAVAVLEPSSREAIARTEGDALVVQRLDEGAAYESLLDSRFGVHSGKRELTLFERLFGAQPPRAAEGALRALAGSVPCFRVALSPRAFSTPDAARALLSRCLGG
jgi:hypothetical protein